MCSAETYYLVQIEEAAAFMLRFTVFKMLTLE